MQLIEYGPALFNWWHMQRGRAIARGKVIYAATWVNFT